MKYENDREDYELVTNLRALEAKRWKEIEERVYYERLETKAKEDLKKVQEYKFKNQPINIEMETALKISSDGFEVKKSGNSWFASKGTGDTIQGDTVCDLFEKIYGTKIWNNDLEPIIQLP